MTSDLIIRDVKGYDLLKDPNNILELLISNDYKEIKLSVEVAIIHSFEVFNKIYNSEELGKLG